MRIQTADRNPMGPQLRELRKERGLTLAELAERVGVSTGHLSRLERGLTGPSFSVGAAIARELGVTAQELALTNRTQTTVNTKRLAALTEAGVNQDIARDIQRSISPVARLELLKVLTGDVAT